MEEKAASSFRNEFVSMINQLWWFSYESVWFVCLLVLEPLDLNFFQADIDNSGTIDYGEFIAATIHLNKLEREEHLVAAFRYFDKDGSGYITVDELQQACAEHNMTDAYLEDVIREVDQDNVILTTLYHDYTPPYS